MTAITSHTAAMETCTACPKLCTFACPAAAASRRETVTPWAKMTLAGQLRLGRVPASAENGDPLGHCLSCRLCTEYCKHEIDVGEALTDTRAWLAQRHAQTPRLEALVETFLRHRAPTADDLGERLHALLPAERLAPEAQVVLFAGCRLLTERGEELQAAFRLFDALGIDFVAAYNGPDLCCGAPLAYAGASAHFARHAATLGSKLQGFKLIIVPCAECAYTLKALYQNVGVDLVNRVRTLGEFLDPYLALATPTPEPSIPTALHMAPHLARHLGLSGKVESQVERALGAPLTPLTWRGSSSYACGSTGVLRFAEPKLADSVAAEVWRQAREVGVKRLLASSPGSAALLARTRAEADPELESVIELFARVYTKAP